VLAERLEAKLSVANATAFRELEELSIMYQPEPEEGGEDAERRATPPGSAQGAHNEDIKSNIRSEAQPNGAHGFPPLPAPGSLAPSDSTRSDASPGSLAPSESIRSDASSSFVDPTAANYLPPAAALPDAADTKKPDKSAMPDSSGASSFADRSEDNYVPPAAAKRKPDKPAKHKPPEGRMTRLRAASAGTRQLMQLDNYPRSERQVPQPGSRHGSLNQSTPLPDLDTSTSMGAVMMSSNPMRGDTPQRDRPENVESIRSDAPSSSFIDPTAANYLPPAAALPDAADTKKPDKSAASHTINMNKGWQTAKNISANSTSA
jgi:hypothetical protein